MPLNDFTDGVLTARIPCFCGQPLLLHAPLGPDVSYVCRHCLRIGVIEDGACRDATGEIFTMSAIRALSAQQRRFWAERN